MVHRLFRHRLLVHHGCMVVSKMKFQSLRIQLHSIRACFFILISTIGVQNNLYLRGSKKKPSQDCMYKGTRKIGTIRVTPS